MEKMLCEICKEKFEMSELISSHETIFDDEFGFACKECLQKAYEQECAPIEYNKVDVVENIKKFVEEEIHEVDCPYTGYRVEENSIIYSYLGLDKYFHNVVVFEANSYEEAIDIVCEL